MQETKTTTPEIAAALAMMELLTMQIVNMALAPLLTLKDERKVRDEQD